MQILSENEIMYLATYFHHSHQILHDCEVPGYHPEPKPVQEIAHQLRVNASDVYALYRVVDDWSEGLSDPMLRICLNLLDHYATK